MYEHVLVPTDGSDGTQPAIEHGTTIADRFGATLHALSVITEGPYDSPAALEERAERAVERVERTARNDGVDVVTTVSEGVPHEEIVAYATGNDVDMIVMGTQGRTGLDRVLVGSVAEQVVRNAPMPVVTVRADGTG